MLYCGKINWYAALSNCNELCEDTPGAGLTDGSQPGDWRLPNVKELLSLINWKYFDPALPNTEGTSKWSNNNPFTGVLWDLSDYYWTSTPWAATTAYIWTMELKYGRLTGIYQGKHLLFYVWPVRGGP